jgi:hypothetical protein
MADVVKLGGAKGVGLVLSCVPDATFKTEITALIAAGTDVIGKLVALTWSNNYEVTSPAAGADFDGEIIDYKKVTRAAGVTYLLSVDMVHFVDQNSVDITPSRVRVYTYDGTTALQDTVKIDGATYDAVEDGGAAGHGAVISIDTTNTTVDVLF